MVKVVVNTLIVRILNLLSRKGVFVAIFMKNMANPSEVNPIRSIGLKHSSHFSRKCRNQTLSSSIYCNGENQIVFAGIK